MLAGYFDLTTDVGFFDAPFTAGALASSGTPISQRPAGSYEALRDRGREAIDRGDLEGALQLIERALEVAKESGDRGQIDRAVCNRSALLIPLGRSEEIMPEMRAILMRNACAETTFAAAHNLSQAHESLKSFKKALFYAQIARDRALATYQSELIAKAHNQLGNCLLGESYFRRAIDEYQQALALLPAPMDVVRSAVLLNVGYANVALGSLKEGFGFLFRSLRWYRRSGKRSYEVWAHLFLCFAYLEAGRLRHARSHGQQALAIAELSANQEALKNILFLLGEVEKSDGCFAEAYEHFERLQEDFYPETTKLPAMMMVCDAKKIVNLRG